MLITVCKNVIMSNNKRKWVDPAPPIRIGKTKGGPPIDHAFEVKIKDKQGNVVAHVISTETGEPVVRCGAKGAIETEYPVEITR